MQRIVIRNFGPIKEVDIPIHDFMIFIGPQASGKSTIANIADFLKESPTIITNYFYSLTPNDLTQTDGISVIDKFTKSISEKFQERIVEYFSDVISSRAESLIVFNYNTDKNLIVEIRIESGNTSVVFSSELIAFLTDFINNVILIDVNSELGLGDRAIRRKAVKFDLSTMGRLYPSTFIPAGRSVFSLLSKEYILDNKLSSLHHYRIFSRYISYIRRQYSEQDWREDHTEKSEHQSKAEVLIERILKGAYNTQRDNDFIRIQKGRNIALENASSGQQEVLWILLALMDPIKSWVNETFVIEEPEAHLYPEAQKYVSELIVLYLNYKKGNQITITTHSPYILSAINNLIYANEVGKANPEKVEKVVDKNLWLDYDRVMAYFVDEGKVRSIMDEELRLIKSEEIDSASRIINEEYNKLSDIEFSK